MSAPHEMQLLHPSATEQPDNGEQLHASQEIELSELQPTDHGKGAWLALCACVLFQFPIWGFSLAFGVFQEYLSETEIKGRKADIAIIGTTSSGILYMLSPISFFLLTKYPHLRKRCGWAGVFLSVVGLLAASFLSQVWELIASLGVLCAVGNGLLFTPTTLYLDEWFVRRKGLALGVMWAGKSIAGVVLPFVVDASLSRFGINNTLRAWACLTVYISLSKVDSYFLIMGFQCAMTAPLLWFIKPRLPLPPARTARRLDMSFLRLRIFWILELGNVIQGLGYFLPSAYLSSFAKNIGFSDTFGTFMLSLLNGTSIFGGIALGMLCDRVDVSLVVLLSSIMSAIAVFFFWGLCQNHGEALLVLLTVLYGFFAGGYSSTWSGILTEVQRVNSSLDTGLVFGLLAGGRGIGNVISGPVSSLLIRNTIGPRTANGWAYSTEYGSLILFTGVTATLAGFNGIWKAMRMIRSR